MIKKLTTYTFALLTAAVLFSSCKKDYDTVQMIDDPKISDFLSKNNITAVADSAKTGYYYALNNPTANTPTYKDTDSVRYSIVVKSMLNGTVYSSTPVIYNLGTFVGYTGGIAGRAVPAIPAVLKKLKPGGTARIFLPSYLAFGKNGYPALKIPSNEILEVALTTYSDKQAVLDDQHIRDFLTANSLTGFTKDLATGVYYLVTEAGTGTDPITLQSEISVNYTFNQLDATLVEQSSEPTKFTLGGTVKGWQVLSNFKKGTKVRIIIPSVMGYGNSALDLGNGSSLPANSCMDYTIEIVDVTNF